MHLLFETDRLYLRRFTEKDAELILDLNSDPMVLQFLDEPLLTNRRHALTILQNTILPQYELNLGRWAVHTKMNNEFIGWCGLKSRPEIQEIDLGYRFKRNSWGQGFGSEAARQTLNYGFNVLNIPEITGRAHIDNLASIKILEKIGMTFLYEEFIDYCPVKTYRSYLSDNAGH